MRSALKYVAAIAVCCVSALAQSAKESGHSSFAAKSGVSPADVVVIPFGYQQWPLVAGSQVTAFDEFSGILGNALAMRAYREGTLPFPDGAILVKLVWKRVPSGEGDGTFVSGPATKMQIMVKDSGKYASTGGWGFGQFINDNPADEAEHKTCFACHQAQVKARDLVFTELSH